MVPVTPSMASAPAAQRVAAVAAGPPPTPREASGTQDPARGGVTPPFQASAAPTCPQPCGCAQAGMSPGGAGQREGTLRAASELPRPRPGLAIIGQHALPGVCMRTHVCTCVRARVCKCVRVT